MQTSIEGFESAHTITLTQTNTTTTTTKKKR